MLTTICYLGDAEFARWHSICFRENENMKETVEELKSDLHSRDQNVHTLRNDVAELTKLFKSMQQLHVQER